MDSRHFAARKTVSLALQGGGSHGAFTWGVLDRLLEDERLRIDALSGTSAGALNAVALASGLAKGSQASQDSARQARDALAQLWDEIGSWGALGQWHAQVARSLWGGFEKTWTRPGLWSHTLSGLVSPYQANPLDLNPLRDYLVRRIDFEAIRRPGVPAVFVSATHVSTGKAVIFHGARLDKDAVLASTCLPTLYRAVEIDGQPYWDGGYSVNPALTPLIDHCSDPDIIIVQINPLRRDGAPRTAAGVLDRINELTFNASLLTQVRAIDLINRLLAQGQLVAGSRKLVRMHRIDGGEQMLAYAASSKSRTDPGLIRELFRLGRSSADTWLSEHFDHLGHQGTIDVQRDYLDDTRLSAGGPETAGAAGSGAASRPWLARLFRRRNPP